MGHPELLVMAAHTLPLVVKLMLEQEKHYVLTDDRAACLATDPLLMATQWVDDRDERDDDKAPSWQKILSKTKLDVSFDRAWENYKKNHPEAFGEDAKGSSTLTGSDRHRRGGGQPRRSRLGGRSVKKGSRSFSSRPPQLVNCLQPIGLVPELITHVREAPWRVISLVEARLRRQCCIGGGEGGIRTHPASPRKPSIVIS